MKHLSQWLLGMALPLALSAGAVVKNGAALHTYDIPAGWVGNMSDNGEWAIWQYPSGDEHDALLSILNIKAGTLDDMPVKADGESVAKPYDITNDGKIVVGTYNSRTGVYFKDKENWEWLPQGSGVYSKYSGAAESVSADGRVVVGTLYKGDTNYFGVYWIWDDASKGYKLGGMAKDMNLPTYKEMHDLGIIDDNDYAEFTEKNLSPMTQFHQVSSDGKKILVAVDYIHPAWGSSYLVYDIEKNAYQWIINEDIKGWNFVENGYMSNNGRYAVGVANCTNESGDSYFMHLVLDTETGDVTVADVDGEATAIDNKGRIYLMGGRTGGSPNSTLCIPVSGINVPLENILSQVYDINFTAETTWGNTGYAVSVSDDCKTLAGNAAIRQTAYTVTLPEEFPEAAKTVNLLQNYAVAPAAGTALAQFKSVVVQFGYRSVYNENVKAKVFNAEGMEIAQSSAATSTSINGNIFRIDFIEMDFAGSDYPGMYFEEGKEYTVVIPAGMFNISGTDFKNDEITVKYVGRKGGPVSVVATSPSAGEGMKEISLNNPVRFEFDTELRAVTGVTGQLIDLDDNNRVKSIVDVQVQGKYLYAYTPSLMSLAKDVKYRITLPAGIVTDVAGFCGCEAVTLDITGTYVPDGGGDKIYRFKEDFSNMSNSLRHFYLYEGDHNQPAEEYVGFEFDADNTPWNFSIRDASDYNYCAGSHSVYNPAGKSDDWMVIPQLLVDNEDLFLKFKVQSYKKNKKDMLKVLVWPSDEVISSLNKDIVDRMRKEGVVIFNEQVFPGSSEESLADDWQEKEFSLADFTGKKVYIAFVNENENQSAVFVDDIFVVYTGRYVAGNASESVLVDADEMKVSAFIKNQHEVPVTKIVAKYVNENTGATDTYTADVNIPQNETYEFEFAKAMKLEKGVENVFNIEIEIDGDKQTIPCTVKNLKYNFENKVMIEEVTGMWCGNCPQGTLAFEYLEKQFPGRIIPVAIHNGDAYANTAYEAFLGTGLGYPSAKVNRSTQFYAPMISGNFYTAEGDQTWYDIASKILNTPAESKITIKQADFCTQTDMMEVYFDVEFALEKKDINYNVFTVVLENELPSRQHNYFYAYEDPIYGEWGANGSLGQQGEYAMVNTDHVARGIAGTSYYGRGKLIPKNVVVDEVYSAGISFDRPANLLHTDKNTELNDKLSIACVLIDATSGEVITGDIIHKVGVREVSGVGEINGDASGEANIILTVADGKILANGNENGVEVYNLNGSRVANEALRGLYIVRAIDEAGNVKVAKLLVK